jgi:low temperature requirement protein LtrA
MIARSPHEGHRVATPLELFFDLVFVVAIARAAAGLHHAIVEDHVAAGLVGYGMTFFAIWWAWMSFTWFASAYDCDDSRYRIAVFVQITGALILAAGIPQLFETQQLNVATVGGYVVMRLAAVPQWLRAAAGDPPHRATARRYAIGIVGMQVLWCLLLLIPEYTFYAFLVLAPMELLVPVWAERAGATTWHPHHIAERYGLMTIIVLGESVLSATMAVQETIAAGERLTTLVPVIVGGLLILFSMWWLYFHRPVHDLLTSMSRAFIWGYGHYVVFAAAAAVGAGLAAAVDQASGRGHIGPVAAGYAVAIPVVLYLQCLWILHYRPVYRPVRWVGPVASIAILVTPLGGRGVLWTGAILAALVVLKVRLRT